MLTAINAKLKYIKWILGHVEYLSNGLCKDFEIYIKMTVITYIVVMYPLHVILPVNHTIYYNDRNIKSIMTTMTSMSSHVVFVGGGFLHALKYAFLKTKLKELKRFVCS